MPLAMDVVQVLSDLNPWWKAGRAGRAALPPYRRRLIQDLGERLQKPKGLIEVIRGPRQVGKTTGVLQIVQDLIRAGLPCANVLFVRFDLQLLREHPAGLRAILDWHTVEIRKRPPTAAKPTYLLLDEVHKLRRWDEEVKHVGDTFPVRLLLTGSSSVLVAHGGRESLAGRVFTTELPAFTFREVLECWQPRLAAQLPPAERFGAIFEGDIRESSRRFDRLSAKQQTSLGQSLDHFFGRGGYPRLYGGDVKQSQWADYLVQTIFDNVLGADIPDLFPIESPGLLRHLYLQVARSTGQILPQIKLAESATAAGIPSKQPTVGRYLRYLADALLIREFRRYPLASKASARVASKFTVSDLGVRNAIFRGAPSLWRSDPVILGPLVETLAQTVMRDHGVQLHCFRDYENARDRRSRVHEVDFVAEAVDGRTLPIEIKFRKRIDREDSDGVRFFLSRFDAPFGIVVTRSLSRWDEQERILYVPLLTFMLAF